MTTTLLKYFEAYKNDTVGLWDDYAKEREKVKYEWKALLNPSGECLSRKVEGLALRF